MIPTFATCSSPPTDSTLTDIGGGGGGGVGVGRQENTSAILGIASLILEGRALAVDEYASQTSRYDCKTMFSGTAAECGRQSPKPSTSRAAYGESFGSANITSSYSIDLANYVTRKSSSSPDTTISPSFLRDHYSNSSSDSTSSSVESNRSRLSQKLSQLLQESPNAHHQAMAAQQKVSIECPIGSDAEYVALSINTDHHHHGGGGLHDDRRGGDFKILRRMSINQMNFYNSPNSCGGSGSNENFMCSLQSLASNTCLRVGTPLLSTTTSPPRYTNNKLSSTSPPRFSPPPLQQFSPNSASNFSDGSSGGGLISINSFYSALPYPQMANSSSGNNRDYLLRKSAATTTSSPATGNHNQTYPKQGPHCDQFLKKMGLAKGDASETEEHHCDMSYVNITCTRWRGYCMRMENILAHGESICIEVYLGPVGHKILLEQWIITQNDKQPPPTMTLPSLCSAIRSQLYFSQVSAWCDLIKKSDKTIYDTGRFIFPTSQTPSAAGDLATITALTSTASIHHTSGLSGSGNVGGVGGGLGCVKGRSLPAPRLNIFYRITQYDDTACFNSKPIVHKFPNVNVTENCSVSVCLRSLPRITGGIPKVHNPISGLTATTTTTPPVNSATTTTTATTTFKGFAAKDQAKIASAGVFCPTIVAAAPEITKTTTNANKPTILKMNCDNNLKELQQQEQKTLTASSSCCLSIIDKYSKPIAVKYNRNQNQNQSEDVDFENDDEHNYDVNARGDNSFTTSCGSSFGGIGASVGNSNSSNSSFSTNTCENLSHREKQLFKYRKRILRRMKKQQNLKTNDKCNKTQNINEHYYSNNKMEQGDDDDGDGEDDDCVGDDDANDDGNNSDTAEHSELSYISINSLAKGQRQKLPNNHIIRNSSSNSIPSTNQQQQHQYHQEQQQQKRVKMISTGTQTITNTCTSCGCEKSMICLKCNSIKVNSNNAIISFDTPFNYDEIMDAENSSSASSLSSSDIIHTPRNNAELLLQAIQRTPKSNKKHKHKFKDSNQMAAISINPKINSNSQNRNSTLNSFNTNGSSSSIDGVLTNIKNSVSINNCQVCKRQKTQHHFNQPKTMGHEIYSEDYNSVASSSLNSSITTVLKTTNSTDHDSSTGDDNDEADNGDKDGGKIFSNDCVDNVSIGIADSNDLVHDENVCDNFNEHEIMEEEYFESSTKLTPHIDRCSLNTKIYYAQIHGTNDTTNSTDQLEYHKQTNPSYSTTPIKEQTTTITKTSNVNESIAVMDQFKTPSPTDQHQKKLKTKVDHQSLLAHKHTPKPNHLYIACNLNTTDDKQQTSIDNNTTTSHNPLLLRRNLPKVNLTPIFCNPNSMMVTSSPISISKGVYNGSSTSCLDTNSSDISITEASPAFSFESPSSPTPLLTVQKSNSAPTLPNSSSLSPRFVKASAINKRRSRHLSDRSDRTSLGSDEQFSDDDIDSSTYSLFATSPLKLRTCMAAVFGRKPLLGNLEECLLQRRLVPKIEVMGFKLLLGASGGFCPTQLTIPATAYFYELKGDTLTTPYLCEIRLPRKGYTVPRCGTVQATLLNPMGTVVRMFVIPYDMRDMPTLHQTFIRQRILADTGMQNINDVIEDKQLNVNMIGNAMSTNAVKPLDLEQQQAKHQQQYSTSQQQQQQQQQQQRSPQCNNETHLGLFISAENMKSLRYSIHLKFQTSRSGRLMLHTDIRLLISQRTDCDTAAAHAKGVLEAPNELITNTVMPTNPKYSARQVQTTSKI